MHWQARVGGLECEDCTSPCDMAHGLSPAYSVQIDCSKLIQHHIEVERDTPLHRVKYVRTHACTHSCMHAQTTHTDTIRVVLHVTPPTYSWASHVCR